MVGYIILGIIILLLVIINLTSVGVDVSYDEGFKLSAKLNWHKIQLIPPSGKKKPKKPKKEKPDKPQPEEEKKEEPKEEKPSKLKSLNITLDDILTLIRIVLNLIGSFKRKIKINNFKFWFVSSDKDPYFTIQVYNIVNDLLSVFCAATEYTNKVSKSDIRTATDFNVGKPYLLFDLSFSIRIGQVVSVGFHAGIAVLKLLLKKKKENKKKLKIQIDNNENIA